MIAAEKRRVKFPILCCPYTLSNPVPMDCQQVVIVNKYFGSTLFKSSIRYRVTKYCNAYVEIAEKLYHIQSFQNVNDGTYSIS